MENKLKKYVGTEYKDVIDSLMVKEGKSKDGLDYCFVSLKLINGYESRIFLRQGADFAFTNAFDLLSANKQINF